MLTNVALEHTRLLGSTVAEIARREARGGRSRRHARRRGGARPARGGARPQATAERLGATLVHAPADAGVPLLAQGAFQRANFATARAAAEALIGPLDEAAVRDAAGATLVPGRFQVVAERPTVVLDGAHNADGIAALAASLPGVARRPPARGGRQRARRQGRRRDVRRAAAALRRRGGHVQREPARASRPRRWRRSQAARRTSSAIRGARWRSRRSSRGRTASSWRPAPST